MQGLVEEPAHGASALPAPQVDEVGVGMRRGQCVDGRIELLALFGEQRLVVEAGPVAAGTA